MTEEQHKVLVRAAEAGYFYDEARAWWWDDGAEGMRKAEDLFAVRAALLVGAFGDEVFEAEVRAGAVESGTFAALVWDRALASVINEDLKS